MPHGPTPDFDRITCVWRGVNLDDSPATGKIQITYNGGVLLDDDPVTPVSIYPKMIEKDIVTTSTITVDGALKTIGSVTFQLPASDDPDIQGSGGTYHCYEKLDNGLGRGFDFEASKDAPDGIIYLNALSAVTPIPGQAVPAISRAEFNRLRAAVGSITGGVVDVGGVSTDPEIVRDTIAAALRAGGLITITPNDSADTITIGTTATAEQLRDRATHTGSQPASSISDFVEAAQDAVGLLLQGASGVTLNYNDAANTLTITGGGTGTGVDAETVRDTIGVALIGAGMVQVVVNDAADTITIQASQALTDALNVRLRVDTDQGLSAAQKARGLANLGAYVVMQRTSVQGIPTAADATAAGWAEGTLITVDLA